REALDRAGSDVEFKNQVDFYAARCTPATAAPPPAAASDSQTKGAPTVASYAVQVLAVKSAAQVDEMLTRLKVMGFDGRVVRDPSGLFTGRAGRYHTHDEAVKVESHVTTSRRGRPDMRE